MPGRVSGARDRFGEPLSPVFDACVPTSVGNTVHVTRFRLDRKIRECTGFPAEVSENIQRTTKAEHNQDPTALTPCGLTLPLGYVNNPVKQNSSTFFG